ncbi:DUF294 nucleotidyltransferase-like domain-containing protein [Litchfieldia alkalitelluris]|uniref:DUF294 nucleotidyltransferase-like domain-containing protein n=1 Tax=Litchfieldia alkalitelluris TaxID=304268 RepID=UPI00099899CC|nr:DUF294 nucleotidyltransferase-like domain-containing protein [Litchfieldia alkalitelluris]
MLHSEHLYAQVKYHPFFNGIEKDDALQLLQQCTVKKYKQKEMIFYANKQREGLLLLLSGIAEVYVEAANGLHEVLEVIQAGELIGFSSLADFLGAPEKETKHMVEVRATRASEALLIPFEVISKRWDDQNVHDYLLTQVSHRLRDVYISLAEQVGSSRKLGENNTIVVRVQDMMSTPVVSVTPNTTIQEVAKIMMNKRTSSVIVIANEHVEGIITERDLVNRVLASNSYNTQSLTAKDIMTKNPITISRFSYFYDALSLLILNGMKHLPVMEGTKVVGVVTLSDLLRKKNENMMKTIQKIETADERTLPLIKLALYDVLATLIEGNVPTLHLLEVMKKLNDRVVNRCVELAISTIKENHKKIPPCQFCLYQMGSSGRGEQFLLTDQDHFLVFENSQEDQYFRVFSEELVRLLEKAGFSRCKGNMMSNYVSWRGDLTTWNDRLRGWTIQSTNENLLLAHNFFAHRMVYGDFNLHKQFEEAISGQLKRGKILFYRMKEVERQHQIPTLDQPIRSLFRLNRKQLDLKKEVLFPYHHSLQILSLEHGVSSGTSIEKIDRLIELNVVSQAFGNDLKIAVTEILRIYISHRWNQYQKGETLTSEVLFTFLTTREKEELMLSLKTLRELQQMVIVHV